MTPEDSWTKRTVGDHVQKSLQVYKGITRTSAHTDEDGYIILKKKKKRQTDRQTESLF